MRHVPDTELCAHPEVPVFLEQTPKTPLPAVGCVSTGSTKTPPWSGLKGTLSSSTHFWAAHMHGAALVWTGQQKQRSKAGESGAP